MATGLEIRAQIDSENAKGLLLINGGAAVALLAFLPSILGKAGLEPVARSILFALFIFLVGLSAAVVHNRLRRICSMVYEGNGFQPQRCQFIPAWLAGREPCVCFASTSFMWGSLIAFLAGGSTVAYGGFNIVSYKDTQQTSACWELQEFQGNIYRTNTCNGTFEIVVKSVHPTQLHNQSFKADVDKATQP